MLSPSAFSNECVIYISAFHVCVCTHICLLLQDLKTPKTGSGTESGEKTAANWPFYKDMHEVLGARPCIEPPALVASFNEGSDATTLLMVSKENTLKCIPYI